MTNAPDASREAWYGAATVDLATLDRQAEELLRKGRKDDAAALIVKGQPLMARLLAIPKPTLAAGQAASDLDELYASMLLANRHSGWARLLYQKNLARWRHWVPQTEDTVARRKAAERGIAACDRQMEQ